MWGQRCGITPHAPRPSPGVGSEGEAALHGCGVADGEGWVLAFARVDGLVEIDAPAPEEQGHLLPDGADDAGDVLVAELRGGEEGDRLKGLVLGLVDPVQKHRMEVKIEPECTVEALYEDHRASHPTQT